ncbi:DUF1016 N-terminal domain-containing protein [Pelodictyon phaeoclathratiforme]|uniref:DUF1016 N-terminal domain-containing protein n=1 Tax=Pelodictyon phaeoclathratiforme TaxID=34090 RepID=UPI0037CA58BE
MVEFEQGGAERSELYGKGLINRLSKELKTLGLKGISSTNLKLCRTFYLAYQKIGQTPSDQSFEISAGLQKIQQMLPVTSFGAIASAPETLCNTGRQLSSRVVALCCFADQFEC